MICAGPGKPHTMTNMFVTNHVLAGALIGLIVRDEKIAFAGGFASHFVCDAVPHWGGCGYERNSEEFFKVAVVDGTLGLATMCAIVAAMPVGAALKRSVIAGMVGAALPDMDKPADYFFGHPLFPKWFCEFHGRIQDEAPDRMPLEVAYGTAFALGVAGGIMKARRQVQRFL